MYGLLASGERQDWSRIPGENDEYSYAQVRKRKNFGILLLKVILIYSTV